MRFGFVTAAISAVRRAVRQVRTKFAHRDVKPPPPKASTSPVVETKGLGKALGDVTAIARITGEGIMQRAMAESAGKMVAVAVKESLRPISRSGRLVSSIDYAVVGGGTAVVFSTAPYAKSILSEDGIDGTSPPVQSILDWMNYKEDFAGLNEKERRRVAYAIRRSLKKGESPGSGSDIGRLRPSGRRAYDYVSEALEQVSESLDQLGITIVSEI